MNGVQARNERGLGDTAVDGLLAGITAGVGMAVYHPGLPRERVVPS